MTAYYSESDLFAAQWLRNLIAAGNIAPGDVDDRDLWDVPPDDVRGYTQVHLCAGIGIWSHAARQAGWEDSRPLWTASFPCQPFSEAGKGLGFADERHLWPAGYHLFRECNPDIILGEQSASPAGRAWLELVQADMENAGYAVGALTTCAAGFGTSPGRGYHLRHRQYWCARRQLADADVARAQGRRVGGDSGRERLVRARGVAGELAHAENHRHERSRGFNEPARRPGAAHSGSAGELEHSHGNGAGSFPGDHGEASGVSREERSDIRAPVSERTGQASELGYPYGERRIGWAHDENGGRGLGLLGQASSGVDLIACTDGKWRPVEGGTFPLAAEDSGRVGSLRAYGNALDAAQAQGFIEAVMECCP